MSHQSFLPQTSDSKVKGVNPERWYRVSVESYGWAQKVKLTKAAVQVAKAQQQKGCHNTNQITYDISQIRHCQQKLLK